MYQSVLHHCIIPNNTKKRFIVEVTAYEVVGVVSVGLMEESMQVVAFVTS